MLYVVIAALAVFGSINADKVAFKDCGSKTGAILSLDVERCSAVPCSFIKGQEAKMTLRFRTDVDTSSLKSKCTGILGFIPAPFKLPEDDTCKLGARCPVAKGEENEMNISLPILSWYPSIGVDVKWQILDEKNNNVICFQIPVKLKSN